MGDETIARLANILLPTCQIRVSDKKYVRNEPRQAAATVHGGERNPLDSTGLCLLSLDGGGTRPEGAPAKKPCKVFDLLGGTSTGGLIAIILGRLGMDVDECIMALPGVRLQHNVGDQGDRAPSQLFHTQQAWNSGHHQPGRLRNLRRHNLLQAGVYWGTQIRGWYARGKNPVDEVEDETSDIWYEETGDLKPLVKCFILIGTGNPGKKAMEDNLLKFVSKTLPSLVT
ncbi:hypothetical protein DTO013E5_6373 [Penicillium roqueforti]|nr:hypothetical protein CBS147332_2113 [Penicillium roqueforti]KAI2739224.1 hypothetical protein DTO012A1_6052 [Penicillium roqueforti]KAI2753670.1 hypothetical protein DTO013F2_2632 [Penicillium roqueforti]KAI3107054.1 hypothetical protein CBS147331_6360 [Penicillium roqueforti]KAI3207394.1 hypothetical protein DTO013E5_6373 [Penicillium roqueforti]